MNGVGGATWGFRWWNGWVSVTFTVKPPPPSLPPPPISSSTYWRGGRGGRTSWNSNQNGGNLHLISKIIIPVQNWKKQKKTKQMKQGELGWEPEGGKGEKRKKQREREREEDEKRERDEAIPNDSPTFNQIFYLILRGGGSFCQAPRCFNRERTFPHAQ